MKQEHPGVGVEQLSNQKYCAFFDIRDGPRTIGRIVIGSGFLSVAQAQKARSQWMENGGGTADSSTIELSKVNKKRKRSDLEDTKNKRRAARDRKRRLYAQDKKVQEHAGPALVILQRFVDDHVITDTKYNSTSAKSPDVAPTIGALHKEYVAFFRANDYPEARLMGKHSKTAPSFQFTTNVRVMIKAALTAKQVKVPVRTSKNNFFIFYARYTAQK